MKITLNLLFSCRKLLSNSALPISSIFETESPATAAFSKFSLRASTISFKSLCLTTILRSEISPVRKLPAEEPASSNFSICVAYLAGGGGVTGSGATDSVRIEDSKFDRVSASDLKSASVPSISSMSDELVVL